MFHELLTYHFRSGTLPEQELATNSNDYFSPFSWLSSGQI